MQLVRSIFSITAVALTSASAFILSDGIAVVHGNLSVQAVNDNHRYASSYLEPFAPEDAVEKPFELVDDHEDLVTNAKGHLVSLRKRGDDCQKYHKVVPGDNCYLLSLKYVVDLAKILEWNPHINMQCTNLYPGKSYCVKKHNESALETACIESYFVKSSDNCISVAKAHNLTLAQFYDLNPSVNRGSCDNLLTGRFYCIRGESKKSIAEKIVEKTTRKKGAQKKGHGNTFSRETKKTTLRTIPSAITTVTTTAPTSVYSKPTHIKQAIHKLDGLAENEENYEQEEKNQEHKKKEEAEKKHQEEEAEKKRQEAEETEKRRQEEEVEKKHQEEEAEKKRQEAEETEKRRQEEEVEKKRQEEEAEKKRQDEEAEREKEVERKRKEEEAQKKHEEEIAKKKEEEAAAEEKAMDKKEEEANKKDSRRLLQKGSDFTYYWIAHPEDYDDSGKSITIRTCEGKSLGSVPESYADALVMEGTGVIGDKVINLGGCSCSNYKCFMEVDKKEDPFGLTSFGTPLRPFITIAANDIKRNTKVYIPQLVGWEIPGSSKKHNGCLLIDDQSWSFTDNHIDFYVYREKNYHTLNNEHKINSVDIYEGGDCNLLNYL